MPGAQTGCRCRCAPRSRSASSCDGVPAGVFFLRTTVTDASLDQRDVGFAREIVDAAVRTLERIAEAGTPGSAQVRRRERTSLSPLPDDVRSSSTVLRARTVRRSPTRMRPSPTSPIPALPPMTRRRCSPTRWSAIAYRIVRRLGEGGMSYVYRAVDQRDNSDVAIKVLTPDSPVIHDRSSGSSGRPAGAAVRSPNVSRILARRRDRRWHLLPHHALPAWRVVERAETRRGPYPVDEAVVLLVQLCEGLQHAHDLDVIHRDLKPENVMLVPDRRRRPAASARW